MPVKVLEMTKMTYVEVTKMRFGIIHYFRKVEFPLELNSLNCSIQAAGTGSSVVDACRMKLIVECYPEQNAKFGW